MEMDNWKRKKPKKIKTPKIKLPKAKNPKVESWEKMPIGEYMHKRNKKRQEPFGF